MRLASGPGVSATAYHTKRKIVMGFSIEEFLRTEAKIRPIRSKAVAGGGHTHGRKESYEIY